MTDEDEYMIPGAFVDAVVLERIRKTHPNAAQQIQHINDLLNSGEETEDDLLQLARLLKEVGETKESEYLLRRNIGEENDAVHQLYLKLHGTAAEEYFMQSVNHFASQFGVKLIREKRNDYLCHTYQTTPKNVPKDLDIDLYKMLSEPCEVDLRYSDPDEITAAVTSTASDRETPEDFPGAEYSYPLIFRDGEWVFDEEWQSR